MQTLTLSDEALALFRLHIERHGDVDVDDTTCLCLPRAGPRVMRCEHVCAVARSPHIG